MGDGGRFKLLDVCVYAVGAYGRQTDCRSIIRYVISDIDLISLSCRYSGTKGSLNVWIDTCGVNALTRYLYRNLFICFVINLYRQNFRSASYMHSPSLAIPKYIVKRIWPSYCNTTRGYDHCSKCGLIYRCDINCNLFWGIGASERFRAEGWVGLFIDIGYCVVGV